MININLKKSEIQAFIVSFVILFLETAFFHILLFTHEYLGANLIISYAVLGLALGSIVTFFFRKDLRLDFFILAIALIFSVLLAFVNIVRFPTKVYLSPFLILPFLIGNIAVTHFFRTEDSNSIYFFTLAGATCGIFFSVFFIPLLKAENTLFLCTGLLAITAMSFGDKKRKILYMLVSALVLAASLALIIINLKFHTFELERITRCYTMSFPKKVFCILEDRNRYQYVLSRDALVSRISAFREKGVPRVYICYDGYSNDTVTKDGPFAYRNDPRLPFMFSMERRQYKLFSEAPHVLAIGIGAQGIVKPLKYLVRDTSLIDAVEINPAIVKIMERDLYAFSKEAFEGIDVKILDARTFLRRTRKKYDLITLLNTYKVQNIGNFGEPDFIHTKEALNEYLDHLDDSGFLLLEERPVNKRAKYAIFRLINNIIHVLKERGSEHPEDHFFIYNWNLTKGKTPMNWYTMIAVKKTPLDESDLDYFKRWLLHHYRREYVVRTSPLHTQIEYLPGEDLKTEYADFMGSDNKDDYFGKGIMLTPTSDDNPYTFDIFAKRSEIKKMLRDMGIICAVIFCAILGILLFSLKKSGTVSSIPFILYFSFLGLGYFIIEIGLLNIYQNFTGSPTNSFIFVLGSLLFSSGIGSYFSGEYSGKKVNCAFIGIILFSLYHLFLSKYVVGLFTFNVLINNLVIALTILPLGFCMGIPFPYGMEKLKRSFGEKYVPVFYAVNCLVSTFAILLGLYLSFVFGFMAAFIFAVVCYLIALIWKNQT